MRKYDKELTPVLYGPSAIKVLHFDIAPHKSCFRTHWHDRMEILRIHSGELFTGYDSYINKVTAGQLMIIPPHMPHKGYSGDYELSYDVLMFDISSFYNDTEICKKYLPAIYDGRAHFQNVTDLPALVKCFDRILATEKLGNSPLETTSDIYRLLSLLLQHCLLSFDSNNSTVRSIRVFSKYIEDNFAQELTTASLSEHFGYTSAHFCRKFKESTGLTPMNYLKIYRLEQAYKFIKAEKRDIGTIAALCGFSDANYFTRCFKAHFGVPPSFFQRQYDN